MLKSKFDIMNSNNAQIKMKYLWWILSVLLISCTSTTDKPLSPLLYADSLIQTGHADSALVMLEAIIPSSLETELSKAWYALLLIQAKDKNYVTHTSDSLICVAVDYFDASGDLLQQAKAHYYWGRVFQDMDDVEGAVREFLTAMPLAEEAKDYELNILLKSNLGLLCWENGLQEEADSLYKATMELAEMHNDSLRLVISLVKRADICMENGEAYYTVAEGYLRKALNLIENIDNRYSKDIVFSSLSYLSEYQQKPQNAILWAKRGMILEPDTLQRQGYYFIVGSAYTQLEQYDSAAVYLNRCLSSENYYTKANAYMKLSEVANVLGKSKEALEYERQYVAYRDSINLLEHPIELITSLKDMLHHQSVERFELFLVQYRFYLLIAIFLFVLAIGSSMTMRKKKNKEITLIIERYQSLYTNIKKLKQELIEKNEEINLLQRHCSNIEASTKQKEQLDGCLKELLEQQRQIRNNLEQRLKEKDAEVVYLRNLNLRHVLSSSPILNTLCDLCNYNKKNPDTMKKVAFQEWETLYSEIDHASLGFVERLRDKYERLLEEDIRFCCLVRLDFKYSDIAYIWGCTSVAVHKRSKAVLEKMEIDGKLKLQEVLRTV